MTAARDKLTLLFSPAVVGIIEEFARDIAREELDSHAGQGGPIWLSVEEAARLEGCSADAIRMRVRRGRYGEPRRVGRRLMVRASSVNGGAVAAGRGQA